jgi:hypothetical protein
MVVVANEKPLLDSEPQLQKNILKPPGSHLLLWDLLGDTQK